MAIQVEPTRTKMASEVRMCSVDLSGVLDDGELLTGTPTITEVTTSDLTLANKSVSTSQLTIDGRTVASGKAVQFKVSGGSADTTNYKIRISVGTDATPAQTIVREVPLTVVAD